LNCAVATAKPRLDGLLDDPVWKQTKPVSLRSALGDDRDWPSEVMMAYDADFLYLAIRCHETSTAAEPSSKEDSPVPADTKTGPVPARRPRDADLSSHDRVEVFLDIDRDYATYYHFTIDDRGWAADDCWGDRTWNPTWHLAARHENGQWTAEAAIPLAELTGRTPQPRDVWAIGVQRVAPGVGFQSWTTPAAVSMLPDGFGLMLFQ
jgi:hypothetical protein